MEQFSNIRVDTTLVPSETVERPAESLEPGKLPDRLDAIGTWIGQDSTQAADIYVEASNLGQSGE